MQPSKTFTWTEIAAEMGLEVYQNEADRRPTEADLDAERREIELEIVRREW